VRYCRTLFGYFDPAFRYIIRQDYPVTTVRFRVPLAANKEEIIAGNV